MPFGVTGAPSLFQRLMDFALCGLSYITCLVYLDDIIVFGRAFDKHLIRLREVFGRNRQANLKLKPSKCSLFRRSVAFLRHVVSEKGIAMQTERVQAIRDWPPEFDGIESFPRDHRALPKICQELFGNSRSVIRSHEEGRSLQLDSRMPASVRNNEA